MFVEEVIPMRVHGQITIVGLLSPNVQLDLVDGLGRLIDSQRLQGVSGRAIINVPALSNGVYLIRVHGQGAVKFHLN